MVRKKSRKRLPFPPCEEGGRGVVPAHCSALSANGGVAMRYGEGKEGNAPATTKACVPAPPFANEAFLVAGPPP